MVVVCYDSRGRVGFLVRPGVGNGWARSFSCCWLATFRRRVVTKGPSTHMFVLFVTTSLFRTRANTYPACHPLPTLTNLMSGS